jgi:two-component system phosphate regulon response regulator PhoB
MKSSASRVFPPSGSAGSIRTIDAQELNIDADGHVTVAGEEVALTALEFKLLFVLVKRRERVQSRGVLLWEAWGIGEPVETRTVDTHVKRLRNKLGGAGRFIQCVPGVGYRFSERPWRSRAPVWTDIQIHSTHEITEASCAGRTP